MLKIFKSKEELAAYFSDYLYELNQKHEKLNIALSGGSTPKVVFDHLSLNYRDKMDWSKMHFFWGDERCVPPEDEQSNYAMTKHHLFSKITIPEENINRILGESEPSAEAMRYANLLDYKLNTSNDLPEFDLVILGMGDDGHTASIFPHEIKLWDYKDHCAVAKHPESGQRRVSINGQVINNAQEVVFLVTGINKSKKVKEIHKQTAGYMNYPASLVKPVSGNLKWLLDEAAASEIMD